MIKKIIWVAGVVLFIISAFLFTQSFEEEINTEDLIGVWQSKDDVLSIREFTENGEVIEKYDGEMIGDAEQWSVSISDNVIHLLINSLSFEIVELNSEDLELIYLDRGNTLEYSRIK